MDLQSTWTAEYESSRYLRELHSNLLVERYGNLIQNLWSNNCEGKVQKARNPDRARKVLRCCSTLFWSRLGVASRLRMACSTNEQ
jgi:hypothetical protein